MQEVVAGLEPPRGTPSTRSSVRFAAMPGKERILRADLAGPKVSLYRIVAVADHDRVEQLPQVLGITGERPVSRGCADLLGT